MEATQCIDIRRLDPVSDEQLIREAVEWINSQPLFYRDCDKAWGRDDADDYIEQMKTDAQADFGVFARQEFIAVITVSLEGKDVYNSHLMAKRGADSKVIQVAAAQILKAMLERGLREGWQWVARKNYGVRKLIESVGMKRDGLERIKGRSHGKPIEWVRYSVRAA